MYGQTVSNGAPGAFPPGVFPVNITAVSFDEIATDNYQGPVLDITYEGTVNDQPHISTDRYFPIDRDRLKARYEQNQNNPKMEWFFKRFPKLEDYFNDERGQTVTNQISDVFTALVGAEEVGNIFQGVSNAIPENATEPQAFAIMAQIFSKYYNERIVELSEKEVYRLFAYRYGKNNTSAPRYSKDAQPWIFPEPFAFAGSKDYRLEPFGQKTPEQTTDEVSF